MKIKIVDSLIDDENFEDLRFQRQNQFVFDAFERVKSYEPTVSVTICDDDGSLIATSYANENTWCGQNTLFISSIKTRKGMKKEDVSNVFYSVIDFYDDSIRGNRYDAILLENEVGDFEPVFDKSGMKKIRDLSNFAIKRSDLIKNLSYRSGGNFDNYEFVNLDLGDIYKYAAFQDTRPGWNTSNLTITKNKFNTLLALTDRADTVYAICAFDERFGIVSRFAVHPLSRQKGFGVYLFREAVHRMKSEYVVVPDIISDAEGSILFLKNMGFELVQKKCEYHKENL